MHLIGVRHYPEHLDETLAYLQTLPIDGRRVMLEIASYPIADAWRAVNPGYVEFYDALAEHALGRGATLLCGESDEIMRKHCALKEELGRMRQDSEEYMDACFDLVIGGWIEREAYTMRQIEEHHPHYVIIGTGHMETLGNAMHFEKVTSPRYAGRSTPSPSSLSRMLRASSGLRPRRASARGPRLR